MIKFMQVLAGAVQVKSSASIFGLMRARWHAAVIAISVLCLLFVPFEILAGDLAVHFNVAFATVPVAMGAWHIGLRRKTQDRQPAGDHVTIRYRCGHSFNMDWDEVERYAGRGAGIAVKQLDLNISCKRCSAGRTDKKQKVPPRLVASVMACTVVIAAVAYGLNSGIASSMITQITSLSNSISNMQDFTSSGGAGDLISGKGSVEDLTSLKGAIPGGDQLELAGIEAYSFADGYVVIGEASEFRLEVAGTDEEKSRGLSFSEGLEPDQAFLVQSPKSTTVTLLSANFEVDVLWLAGNTIVDIAQGVTECRVMSLDQVMQSSGSGCVYEPSATADTILYLDGGTVERIGIDHDDAVTISVF